MIPIPNEKRIDNEIPERTKNRHRCAQGEKPKAYGGYRALGKSTIWSGTLGRTLASGLCPTDGGPEVAITRARRLFNTNLAFRKSEKMCTEGASCTARVGQYRAQPE